MEREYNAELNRRSETEVGFERFVMHGFKLRRIYGTSRF